VLGGELVFQFIGEFVTQGVHHEKGDLFAFGEEWGYDPVKGLALAQITAGWPALFLDRSDEEGLKFFRGMGAALAGLIDQPFHGFGFLQGHPDCALEISLLPVEEAESVDI